jgi:hypothetical protein
LAGLALIVAGIVLSKIRTKKSETNSESLLLSREQR